MQRFQNNRAVDCDTIYLTNGQTYYGSIIDVNRRVIKCIKCYTNDPPHVVTIYLRDIKKVKSNKITYSNENQIDTTKFFHFGVIPYQLLTRSSGIYLRYDLKKISLEYRPTYTYAFPSVSDYVTGGVLPIYYDNYYFQGINNSFLFFKPFKKNRIGIILSYKYWWHDNQSIDNDQSGFVHDDVNFKEIKSTYMNGIGAGVEYTRDIGNNHSDCNFFMNATITDFISHSHVVSLSGGANIPPYAYTQTYPYNETKNRPYINVTCGFKFGFKKPLKK